jgi:hypothetical protein
LESCLTVEDINNLIVSHGKKVDEVRSISYDELVPHLIKLLLEDKQVPFESLIPHKSYSLPSERISKFLRMLMSELEDRKKNKKNSVLEDMQIKEVKFALKHMNERSLFKTYKKESAKNLAPQLKKNLVNN